MKRKILIFCLLIALSSTAIISGTLAYFTAEDTAHNVITSGGVDIKVVEKTKGKDGILIDFPKDGMSGVMPGATVSKIVSIKNTGKSEAWVRVKVKAIITSAENKELPIDVISYEVGENWHMDFDGYIYYSKPLPPGEVTEILFDKVHFAPEMGNEYQSCTSNISISAQAVQTANNGKTIMEAKGWPTGE